VFNVIGGVGLAAAIKFKASISAQCGAHYEDMKRDTSIKFGKWSGLG